MASITSSSRAGCSVSSTEFSVVSTTSAVSSPSVVFFPSASSTSSSAASGLEPSSVSSSAYSTSE